MIIAPYYRKLLRKALVASTAMEPITFVGMYDSGIDYLFGLSIPLFKDNLKNCTIISDVSAVEDEINKGPVLLVLYLDQDGITDSSIFQLINRIRHMNGWKFSYVLFASTRMLEVSDTTVQKVLMRNLVPVLPLSEKDALVVLQNYEERYEKKVSAVHIKQIIEYSGGNPGLIKALYLQIIGDPQWKAPDVSDEQLSFRLKGIFDDKPDPQISVRYGYNKIPLVFQMKGVQVDPLLLIFSKSQRKIVEFLKGRSGKLVTKDDVAKELWGDNWAEKYSDWAIDQLISTLREKLASVDKNAKIISKRGEGIIYLPV